MRDFRGCSVRLGQIGKTVEPSVADSCFQGLSKSDHLLIDGVAGRRLAALCYRFFVAMNAVVLDLAGSNLRQAHRTEKGALAKCPCERRCWPST
jgi:hypothetical protein